jgi:hypothetical protein
MKKIRKGLATFAIALCLTFGSGAFVQVRADGGSGPQGQTDSRSGGPSAPSMTQAEYEYFIWLIVMWLLGWL